MRALIAVLATLIAAAAWWWLDATSVRPGVSLHADALRLTEPLPAAPRGDLPNTPPAPARAAPATASNEPLDPVGGAADLKRVFDQAVASRDPRQRLIAGRAFDACVPAFLPAGGETPSPEPLIRALPSGHRAEREAAYWSLYARCQGFAGLGRAALQQLQREVQSDPQTQEPGRRVEQDLLAGRAERVDELVSQALNTHDPAAVASLAGVAARLALQRGAEAADPQLAQRARAVDAALPWVACDLGLDCSAGSVRALQLCAVQGLCDGDVPARLGSGATGEPADDAAVQQERGRLLALIATGRALTTRDLLP